MAPSPVWRHESMQPTAQWSTRCWNFTVHLYTIYTTHSVHLYRPICVHMPCSPLAWSLSRKRVKYVKNGIRHQSLNLYLGNLLQFVTLSHSQQSLCRNVMALHRECSNHVWTAGGCSHFLGNCRHFPRLIVGSCKASSCILAVAAIVGEDGTRQEQTA